MEHSLGPGEPPDMGEPLHDGPGMAGEEPRSEGALPLMPLSELEEKIGYTFKDRQYLVNALIHKSYLH
ncbi:MAG: hypothetical protein M3328_16320, partial [Chloroflexota bacterium]|nr:hypothetical protein [Chloroflexota bacterium]